MCVSSRACAMRSAPDGDRGDARAMCSHLAPSGGAAEVASAANLPRFPKGDAAELSRILIFLLVNHDELRGVASRGQRAALDEFSFDRIWRAGRPPSKGSVRRLGNAAGITFDGRFPHLVKDGNDDRTGAQTDPEGYTRHVSIGIMDRAQGAHPSREGLGAAGWHALAPLARERPDEGDAPRAGAHERRPDQEPAAHMGVGEPMRAAMDAGDASLGPSATMTSCRTPRDTRPIRFGRGLDWRRNPWTPTYCHE